MHSYSLIPSLTTLPHPIHYMNSPSTPLSSRPLSSPPLSSPPHLYIPSFLINLQSVEEQIGKLREDADVLINPRFLPDETEAEENMHEATKGAVERVKTTIKELNDIYQQLITMCQQKRDLFIVCVKFHMTTRQVMLTL